MIKIVATIIASYIVTRTAAISLECPRVVLGPTSAIGVVSYSVYLISLHFNIHNYLATFLACFVAAMIAKWSAIRFKAPVTMFYLPTFFLYVPGSAIYLTAYSFINQDINLTLSYLLETISIAGAIAMGVFMSDSIQDIYYGLKGKYRKI